MIFTILAHSEVEKALPALQEAVVGGGMYYEQKIVKFT